MKQDILQEPLSTHQNVGGQRRYNGRGNTGPEQECEIAILIPCHNEEVTVGKVIDDFRRELPSATIYVFDNCSTDATAKIAQEHGAVVFKESRKGKGFVIDSMFARIKADFYVLVDGDDTYPAEDVHKLLEPVVVGDADMVVGGRLASHTADSFRSFHLFGNKLVGLLVNWISRSRLTDIMSGYRAFNRRVVRQIPVVSSGFEVETDLTLQMLYYNLKVAEVDVSYRERCAGSQSKLRTFQDGFRVLWKIFNLLRSFKPLTFFGGIGLLLFLLGLLTGAFPILDYLTYRYVYHVPLAILAAALMILSAGFIFLGILLHVLNWRLRELHNVFTRDQ